MDGRTTVALIGIAGYGDTYLAPLLAGSARRDYRLVAVADPAPERSRSLSDLRERGIRVYENLDDLLAGYAPDLVVMASPIYVHARDTIRALAAGSSVLCEKPAAATAADVRRMCDAQQRAPGRFVAIGFQWSFSRAIQRLKADILAGTFGRPLTMRSLVLFPRGDAYYARNRWAGRLATNDGQPVFDSPVNNAAAHYLHNMLYLLGHDRRSSETPVHLQAELYRANRIESYDTAVLRTMTPCGAEVSLATSHATGRRIGPQFRFKFERATVTYGEEAPHDHVIARLEDGRVVDYGAPEADRDEKLWQCIAAAREGAAVDCDVAAALPHALCVDAARRSFEAPVTIPAEQILRRAVNGDGQMSVVAGLEEAMLKCHRLGATPFELGIFKWARAGKLVQLCDFTAAAKSRGTDVERAMIAAT